MSKATETLKDFKISYRLNEGVTNFTATFPDPLSSDDYDTGVPFEFYVYDNTYDGELIMIKGIVEDVDDDGLYDNQIFSLRGRDVGLALVTQPFSLECTAELAEQYTVEDLLLLILEDTGITLGRGATPLSKRVVLNTSENSKKRFCGSWNTKEEAINQLFSQYSKVGGSKRFRWYINYAGYFRWFETDTERGGKEYIFKDDIRIMSLKFKKSASSIVNEISGTYGDEDTGGSVTRSNTASKAVYGRRVGSPINEQKYTRTQLIDEIDRELAMKAWPIHTATMTMHGMPSYEVGTQIKFPDDKKHGDKVFTVTDYTITGVDGKVTTDYNLTTDESAISIPNEFDTIEATTKQVVNDSKLTVATVTAIPNKNDDHCIISKKTKTGYIQSMARNPGGKWS
jgi:hypothetical protein